MFLRNADGPLSTLLKGFPWLHIAIGNLPNPPKGVLPCAKKIRDRHILQVYRTSALGLFMLFHSHFRSALFSLLTFTHSTSTRSISHARQTNTRISQTSNSHSLDTKHVFLAQVNTFKRFRTVFSILRFFKCDSTKNQLIWMKIRCFRIFRNFPVGKLQNCIFRNSNVALGDMAVSQVWKGVVCIPSIPPPPTMHPENRKAMIG